MSVIKGWIMKIGIASGFVRKNAVVLAVQVTQENLSDLLDAIPFARVAATNASGMPEMYIQVPVVKHSYDNKPKRAFVGDYILLDDQGYKVYRAPDFERMYDALTSDMIDQINTQMDEAS